MPPSSLRDIEKTLTHLWMNRSAREEFLKSGNCGLDLDLTEQIDRSGVELYAGLLNYGHQDVMSSIYPLCAKIFGRKWETVVDDYLEAFPPDHFNLNRTAQYFPNYVADHLSDYLVKYPFLSQLADYEWVELEMIEHDGVAPKSDLDSLETPEQFAIYGPIINPALTVRHYDYPIIKIAERLEGAKRKPGKVTAQKTNVVIYRDPKINRCRFLEVGPVAAAILEKAIRENATYNELMKLAVTMAAGDAQQTISDFLELVEQLQDDRLFLGNSVINSR